MHYKFKGGVIKMKITFKFIFVSLILSFISIFSAALAIAVLGSLLPLLKLKKLDLATELKEC